MALLSKIVPRWYQHEAVDLGVWKYFEDHPIGNPVIALPTGTGKSVVIAMICKRAITEYPQTRILKLTHVKELIQQNFEELLDMWPTAPAGIYSAGIGRRDLGRAITFAGIASVAKIPEQLGHIDLVIIDEAHMLGDKEGTLYEQLLTALWQINPNIRIIGLTATPYRMGHGLLTDGSFFNDISYDLTGFTAFNSLIVEGFLAPLVPKQTDEELDVTGVQVNNTGDYNLNQLQAAVDKEEITARAIKEMLAKAGDRKHWLIFASGVEHSDHVADELMANGIWALSVHSKMTDAHIPAEWLKLKKKDEDCRALAIRLWKEGKVTALVNNNVLTTGINFRAIDFIGVLRPTKSVALWVQMLGRGTRPCEGKENCLVLDFAGNTKRLGPINDPVLPRKKGEKGAGGAPVKVCPVCNTYNHASVRFCTNCGEEFVARVNFNDTADNRELIRVAVEPVFENFEVKDVTYHVHTNRFKPDKPPMLRVTYFTEYINRHFSEYICFEHLGYPLHKAHEWWKLRMGEDSDMPLTVAEANNLSHKIPKPRGIRVWLNRKGGPEIKVHDFGDGLPE